MNVSLEAADFVSFVLKTRNLLVSAKTFTLRSWPILGGLVISQDYSLLLRRRISQKYSQYCLKKSMDDGWLRWQAPETCFLELLGAFRVRAAKPG